MKKIHVDTGRPYEVIIEKGCLDKAGFFLREAAGSASVFIVTDSHVAPLYLERLEAALHREGYETKSFVFEAGEASKNLRTFGEILEKAAAERYTRKDIFAALGGGVTGDLTGFAAACYQRGVPFIQIPTTYLAAVDSSVGGKTGLDLSAGKNLAGAFWQPSLVLCDYGTFSTLDESEIRNGIAEAVKTSMLRDASMIPSILAGDYETVIERCVSIKRSVVEEDERDTGSRQLLNFGHTIGHAIEALSSFTIPHGHAVAKGMIAESRSAFRMGLTDFDAAPYLTDILTECGFDLSIPYTPEELYTASLSDKKRAGRSITVIVPVSTSSCRLEALPLERLPEYMEKGLL